MSVAILLVDDDPTIREFVSIVLEDEGFTVTTAPNGVAALQQASATPPSLILLDMHMPLMNGWDFAEAYYRQVAVPAPIIIMTAAHSAKDIAAQVRASAVLAKPFHIDDLIALVRKWSASPNT
ncbi:MAG: response regulator [Roseiflexaceae bacterium]|nr:response regulator [Roseiflexaceae bacterium]